MVRLFCITAVLLPLQLAFVCQAFAQVDRFTSEEHPPAVCNPDHFMKVARCHGDYCDSFGLTCQKIPGVKWGAEAANGMFVSAGGKCLDVRPTELNRNGALLRVWDCNGEPQQRWASRSRG